MTDRSPIAGSKSQAAPAGDGHRLVEAQVAVAKLNYATDHTDLPVVSRDEATRMFFLAATVGLSVVALLFLRVWPSWDTALLLPAGMMIPAGIAAGVYYAVLRLTSPIALRSTRRLWLISLLLGFLCPFAVAIVFVGHVPGLSPNFTATLYPAVPAVWTFMLIAAWAMILRLCLRLHWLERA